MEIRTKTTKRNEGVMAKLQRIPMSCLQPNFHNCLPTADLPKA